MSGGFEQGLRDVIAVESTICQVDGGLGRLRFRGYDIGELAGRASFEEVIALLWDGDLPGERALRTLRGQMASVRALPPEVINAMEAYPRAAHPLEALRTAVSHLSMHDPDGRVTAEEAVRRKCVRLTAQVATAVAAWRRIREGRSVVPLDPALSHAENFLHLLDGLPPQSNAAAAMDALLVLHAEHELNASTFAARVVTATFSDVHAAVTAALAALKGPRHGGANEDVLAMLEAIGAPERAEGYIGARLAARERMSRAERADPAARIPGWGHPVYTVDDPRAAHLRTIGRRLAEEAGVGALADTAESVYRVMKAHTDLPVNVDFFSAVIYRALAIPIDLCTSIFAVARVAGWCAHIMEQYGGRLIRPRAAYLGPAPRPFVPLAARRPDGAARASA